MPEESNLTAEQVNTYLRKLGIERAETCDLKFLSDLIFAHQCSIPFSTADVYHSDSHPDLTLSAVYNKAIMQERGGYCFELNLLFEALLRSLGFDARPVLARPVFGDAQIPISHRSVLVTIDQEAYYADVGFGGAIPEGALLLDDMKEQTVRGEVFRSRQSDDTWWIIEKKGAESPEGEKKEEKEFQPSIEICLASVRNIDFESLNFKLSSPGSNFYESRIINLKTEDGHRSLNGSTLTVRSSKGTEKRELKDEQAIALALEKYFGIT